jgi:hypothetical protein
MYFIYKPPRSVLANAPYVILVGILHSVNVLLFEWGYEDFCTYVKLPGARLELGFPLKTGLKEKEEILRTTKQNNRRQSHFLP